MAIIIQILIALLPILLKLLGLMKKATPGEIAALPLRAKYRLAEVIGACQAVSEAAKRLGIEPMGVEDEAGG